ncbi:unnamed protein product [Peronospora belbahrii]|uniref:Uncharacterized protein n=1 Tax=Peronospora belbahrii TaxID=622444 RepID=A0AAU9KUP7_9STRA|nr:unnamed protein product [Peronospora belbahrii]CAH0515633.1 unnamed protein product [Peronospora belbahrii]
MPRMNWLWRWRQNSTDDEATISTVESSDTKKKPEHVVIQSSSRPRSQVPCRHASWDELPSVTANNGLQHSTCKLRRRFTIHGLSYRCASHEDAGWNCNFAPKGHHHHSWPSASLSQGRPRSFGSGRTLRASTFPLVPNNYPSIIFIDCPP